MKNRKLFYIMCLIVLLSVLLICVSALKNGRVSRYELKLEDSQINRESVYNTYIERLHEN